MTLDIQVFALVFIYLVIGAFFIYLSKLSISEFLERLDHYAESRDILS